MSNGTETPNTSPGWLQSRPGLATTIAFAVVILYVLPVYLILVVILRTQGLQEDSLLYSWFAAFMKSGDSTLNLFHKILFPVLTALSVLAYRGTPTKGMLSLGGFLLVSLAAALSVAVFFDMDITKQRVKGLNEPIDLTLVKAFFSRIQESIMMYFMLLLGLGISGQK